MLQFWAARRTPYLTPSTTLSSTPLRFLPVQRRSSATFSSLHQLAYSPSLAENYNSWLWAHNDVITDHGYPANAILWKLTNAMRRTRTVRRTVCCTGLRMTPTTSSSVQYDPRIQQIFSALYVTSSKLIRHVSPLAPLREFLDDDDDWPRTYGGREKGHQFVKFGYTFSSACQTM